MIQLIIGDDTHAIEEFVASQKPNSEWADLNTHEYSTDQLTDAIADAASPGFGCSRLIIIRRKVATSDKPQWQKLVEQALGGNTVLVLSDGTTPAWFKSERKSYQIRVDYPFYRRDN